MAQRNNIQCPICLKNFFKASFPFHIKVCAKQNSGSFETLICPLCNVGIQGHLIAEHVKKNDCCRIKSNSYVNNKLSDGGHGQYLNDDRPLHTADQTIENSIEMNKTLKLKPCQYCKRKFRMERILAHEKICKKVLITPKRNIFNSSLKRQASDETIGFGWSSKDSLINNNLLLRKNGQRYNNNRNPAVHRNNNNNRTNFASSAIKKKKNPRGSIKNKSNYLMEAMINKNKLSHGISKTNVASQSNPLAPNHSRYDNVEHYY